MLQSEFLKHLDIKDKDRDLEWESTFLNIFPKVFIDVDNDLPRQGSDGMCYMLVSTNKNSKETTIKLLNWAYDKGVGIAVNPQKHFPDFIFTYGMIWNFKETNHFLTSAINANQKPKLPSYVRSILKQFFLDQGAYQVKFTTIKNQKKQFDLCFCASSLGNPPGSEHAGILKALSWFLPQHYPIAIVQNSEINFEPL